MVEYALRPILQKDEIRVLVHDDTQSRSSGLLACQTRVLKLSHVQAGTETSYAALSYVWGDAAITKTLICDGKKISVTVNLHDALLSLWLAYPALKIWADALSIVQGNILERNHQVSLMGNIYRSASCVFAFIGPPLDGGNRFWDFLKKVASNQYAIDDEFEDDLDEFLEGQTNDFAKGYHDLITRPWFTRAWTYQEIRLAAAAKIVCGSSMISWNSFMASLWALDKKCLFMRRFSSLRAFLNYQHFWIENKNTEQDEKSIQRISTNQTSGVAKPTLYDTLLAGWRRDSSDARDKIYAFTSPLLSSSRYTEITPDYTLDMRSIFIRFIRVYINNENNLDFLLTARGVDEPVWFLEPGF
ncbi:hypothetical protein FPOAC2_03819 [Fusarium poae]|uniref:hypothetical protein n=1 Tax=Fusarium poae TaxID=36050 RepID=UPI001CE7369E|nr:hypothetical protein FPOAC1_003714 [Fusarium poae]KAG8677687.1 hypothetical protein FPOAC1_003714 [Fusarium poae]